MGLGGGGLEGLTSGAGGGVAGGSAVTGIGIWRYRTETSAPPSSGQLRFNNSDIESATVMWLHETNSDGTDMANFLDQLGVGAFLYIQDRTDAGNFIVVQIASNVDSGSYRTFSIALVELQGVTPSNNTQVAIVATGDPSPEAVFPIFEFGVDDLLDPDSSDWEFNPGVALLADDTNNNAIRVRLFDDTVEESVGWQLTVPAGAASIEVQFKGRAETAPAGTRQVRFNLANRGIPDNAVVESPWAQINLANIDLPTNEFFQYDSAIFALASLGIVAGDLHQFQLTRRSVITGTELTGDYALASIRVVFT